MSKKMPGVGYNIFKKKNKKICVINLMTNKFMPKSQNVFKIAHSLSKKFKMTKNVDFIIIDIHGEYAAEKKSIGYLYDGKGNPSIWNAHIFQAQTLLFSLRGLLIKLTWECAVIITL